LDRRKATQAKFKFLISTLSTPAVMSHAFSRTTHCLAPRGGSRGRSGFALSLQPKCCPVRAHASQSGAGLGPMAAPPLLSAPAHYGPPLVPSRPQGLGRSEFRVSNPHALDRTAPEPLHEGCSPRVSGSLACRASFISPRRDHTFLDLLPCRCLPVNLLPALDHILDASKQLACAAS